MLFNAAEDFVGAEFEEIGFFLFQTVGDFVPSDRRGNSRLFPGAERVNADRGLVFVVLAPVDEYFPFPHRFRHVRGHKVSMFSFQKLRERAG